MSMTIYAVKLYKLNNIQWVFDDPERNIIAEAFVAGADTKAVDSILEHGYLDPEGDLILLFSTKFFPPNDDTYKITISHKPEPGGGTSYNYNDHDLWLCDTLLDYYKKPPKQIYFQIKGVQN